MTLAREPEGSAELSPLLAELMADALEAARETDGAVDPTLGSVLVGLGYDRDLEEVRRRESMSEARPGHGRTPRRGLAHPHPRRPAPPAAARAPARPGRDREGRCCRPLCPTGRLLPRDRCPGQPRWRHRHGRPGAGGRLAGARAGPAERRTPADHSRRRGGRRDLEQRPAYLDPGGPAATPPRRPAHRAARRPAPGAASPWSHRRPARQHRHHGGHGQGRRRPRLAAQHRPASPAGAPSRARLVTLGGWPREAAA